MNQSQAQLRNAAARRLIARNRLREALDVLNDAIRVDPRWAESYHNRATVFERMGMYPQAEADRRKVEELGGVQRPEPLAPTGVEPGEPTEKRKPSPAVLPRYPVAPRPSGGGATAFRALGTVLITVGLFVAAGIGIFLALDTLTDAINDEDSTVGAPTGAAGGSETPSASGDGSADGVTATPAPEAPEEVLRGDPLSFSRLQAAWREKQIESAASDVNSDVSGFKTTAVNVTLSRSGSTMLVALLLYDGADLVKDDWDFGAEVTPKAGRSMPAGAFAWYNANAVVVVLQADESMRPDARDAFFAITS